MLLKNLRGPPQALGAICILYFAPRLFLSLSLSRLFFLFRPIFRAARSTLRILIAKYLPY